MKPLFYGYPYSLNELLVEKQKEIYHSLYDNNKIDYLKNKYYPGNDTKLNEVYNQIINHFKIIPQEGWFLCLWDKLFYHFVPSGFPRSKLFKQDMSKM